MNIGKKNLILAIVLCISITVIGVSFAYFTSSINVGGSGSSVDLNTESDFIKVVYDAGVSSLTLENAMPGEGSSKSFTVSITPTTTENTATYSIYLDITSNTFEKCSSSNQNATNNCTIGANEVTYSLKDASNNSVLASGDLTEASGRILLLRENKTVSGATTYTYNLEITYVNTGAEQNHNQNKTLNGSIKVEFSE